MHTAVHGHTADLISLRTRGACAGDDWADDLAAMLEARGDELRKGGGGGAKPPPQWEPRA